VQAQCSAAPRNTDASERREREREKSKELRREQGLGCCLYESNGKKKCTSKNQTNSSIHAPSVLIVYPILLICPNLSINAQFFNLSCFKWGIFIIIEIFIKKSIKKNLMQKKLLGGK